MSMKLILRFTTASPGQAINIAQLLSSTDLCDVYELCWSL